MKLVRSVVVLVAAAAMVACEEDVKPVQSVWEGINTEWTQRVDALKKTHADLLARVQGFEIPSGNAELAQLRASLDEKLKAESDAVANVEKVLADSRAGVEKALAERKVAAVQGAIDKAKNDVPPALAKVNESLEATAAAVSQAEPAFTEAKGLLTQLKVAAEALARRLTELTKTKGEVDVQGIQFKEGTASIDEASADGKAQLDRLVGFMKTCKELTVNLTGHTSKEGKPKDNEKLSAERAAAVKAYLVAQGVDAKQVGKTGGMGAKRLAVAEPDPGSEEEKAMKPADLAMARSTNRRVTVEVVKPCP